MLRWSDELRVGLSPDRLAIVRVGKGWRARITQKQVIHVSPAPSSLLWGAPLEALSVALKDIKPRHINTSITLSGRFVRYAVVPWQKELMQRVERIVQARHCFRQIHGEVVEKWVILIDEAGFQQPFLATAVDVGLIDGLRAVCNRAGVRLTSITPFLTAAYGQFRKTLAGARYFTVVEPDAMGTLQFDNGALCEVSNQRIGEDWAAELLGTYVRNGAERIADIAAVFAPSVRSSSVSDLAGFKMVALPAMKGFSPITDATLSMAVAGII